jgi:Tol biopolymer transport system component
LHPFLKTSRTRLAVKNSIATGADMLYLRLMLLLIFIAGLFSLGCDNPLQSQQKLDDWENSLLSGNVGEVHFPTCSPDGSTIAFVRERRLRELYTKASYYSYKNSISIIDGYFSDWSNTPPISQDGDYIVYKTTDKKIMVENLQNGHTQIIFQSDAEVASYPKWSADGQYIYYLVNYHYIEKVSRNGDERTRIAPGQIIDSFDSFELSPDGEIYLISGREDKLDATYDIYLFSVVGELIEKLTENDRDEQNAAWAPDGTSIAFVQEDSNRVHSLISMSLFDSDSDTLATNFLTVYGPLWTNDSKNLVFYGSNREERGVFRYSLLERTVKELDTYRSYDIVCLKPGYKNSFLYKTYGDYYNISTITMDSVVVDLTKPSENINLYPNWAPDGSYILYSDDGVNRLAKDGGQPEKLNLQLDASWNYAKPSLSPDGKFLTVSGGSWTSFYNYETLELLYTQHGIQTISWAPEGDKFACFEKYRGVAVYELIENMFYRTRSFEMSNVYAVDWLKAPAQSEFEILCCAPEEGGGHFPLYEMWLFDENLENRYKFISKYGETLYGSWTANGADIVYSHGSRLRIRRAFSNF